MVSAGPTESGWELGGLEVLMSPPQIASAVKRLAEEISSDHPQGVLLIGVLKGSAMFLADLARQIQGISVGIDFISLTPYMPGSATVQIALDLQHDITSRDVVVVVDFADTGLSLNFLLAQLGSRGPRSVSICALLDRPSRRILPLAVRYVGREIAGEYVVGYGIGAGEKYRALDSLVVLRPR